MSEFTKGELRVAVYPRFGFVVVDESGREVAYFASAETSKEEAEANARLFVEAAAVKQQGTPPDSDPEWLQGRLSEEEREALKTLKDDLGFYQRLAERNQDRLLKAQEQRDELLEALEKIVGCAVDHNDHDGDGIAEWWEFAVHDSQMQEARAAIEKARGGAR